MPGTFISTAFCFAGNTLGRRYYGRIWCAAISGGDSKLDRYAAKWGLHQIFIQKKMPEQTSFYMFYGHRGNRNPFSSNNDGTITLSSLLDYRSQAEAKMNYAFNEDHTSIIFSQDAVAQYNTILNEFDEKQDSSLQRSGGYLNLHIAYNYDSDSVRPSPTLILHPVDRKDGETVIYLNGADDDRILGPFPLGAYTANITAIAAKSEKTNIPVLIESNTTKELDFVLLPDGVIRGCVTASLEPEDKSVGMPDYKYRSVDREVNIQSITLEGNGVHRILHQVEGEDVDNYDYLISRADFCYNTCFGFFGVPAGEYTLSIEAEGYKSIEKEYSVTPGVPEYFRITELKPD